MKKLLLILISVSAYFSLQAQQSGCQFVTWYADNTTIYKMDADGDGVKDFWFYVTGTQGNFDYFVVGKNGSEIEVDEQNGTNANHLEQYNQIGNNFWNDTAYFINNGSGNFAGANTNGYIGLNVFKSGNHYLAFAEIHVATNQAGIGISVLGYNSTAGGPLAAGDCTIGIDDPNAIADAVFVAGNNLNVILNAGAKGKSNTMQLYNLEGRLLQTAKLEATENKIALHAIPKGIYLAVISSDDKIAFTKRVLVSE